MVEIDKYLAIPIISGILILVSLLIPIAYLPLSNSTFYAWPFGVMYVVTSPDLSVTFGAVSELVRGNLGVAVFFLYLVAIIILLSTSYKYQRHALNKDKLVPLWLLSGGCTLIGYISSIISLGFFILDDYLATIIGLILIPIAIAFTIYGALQINKEK